MGEQINLNFRRQVNIRPTGRVRIIRKQTSIRSVRHIITKVPNTIIEAWTSNHGFSAPEYTQNEYSFWRSWAPELLPAVYSKHECLNQYSMKCALLPGSFADRASTFL